MFASLLVACELLVQCSATYYAHVTSSGTINDYCTLSSPCGLFPTVLDNIRDGTIPSTNANDDITIIINGTNPQLPYACVSSGYLYEMHHNITIIFDPNGSPTTDSWFPGVGDCLLFASCVPGTCVPSSLFHMHAYSSLKIYNMIWESVDYLFIDSEEHSSFYCENCTFKNLHGNLILLLANSAVFYDCLFDNITGLFLRMYPIPTTDMSAATHTNINISHCQFTNIAATNFIQMDSTIQYKKSVHIEYSSIHTKPGTFTRFIYVAYGLPFTNTQNTISIQHSSFYGEISVLYVERESVVNVILDDVDVSYSQYLPANVLDYSTDTLGTNPRSVLFIGSDETSIDINTLTVTTLLYCTTDRFSFSPELRRRLSVSRVQPYVPYCAYPVPFMINSGALNIYNMTLLSDYDAEYWQSTLQTVIYNNSGMYYMLRFGKFDPTVHQTNEPYLASILNNNHGSLRMDRVRVGIGAHYSLLYNKGDAMINNMQTDWYLDPELYYNRWQLRLASYITNRGYLEIRNSALKGCDGVLIHIYGGSVRIIDSILSQSMNGIVTFYSADSVYIQNVSADQIGRYYATLGAAYYFSGGTEYDDIAPVHLAANDIIIVDSLVLYTDPLGIVSVCDHGLYETGAEQNVNANKTIYMNNNTFIIDASESFTDFSYLSSLLTGMFETDAMLQFVTQFESTSRASIGFEGSYTVIIGNSIFEARNVYNQSVYINVDTTDNCMASNRYYNFDVIIQSGNILSCKHVEYARMNHTQNNSCFDAMGALNIAYKNSNTFVNSLIVLNHSLSTVYIDDAVLDSSYIHIIQAYKVKIFDTILSYRSLSYPSYCALDCYQIMQRNHSKIRQLILNCNDAVSVHHSINDNYTTIDLIDHANYEMFSFFSAFAILLNTYNQTNNTLLYPGGVIHIAYSIMDKYDNVISDYPDDIHVHLLSTELNINTMINIIENECDLCATGVYVPAITIHHVGQQYTIQSSVMNDILLSNDILVQIIPCPSGFGIAGATSQCAECTAGYYSIQPNAEACHTCGDEAEGIACMGGDYIAIEYNYWMYIMENHVITSNDCPNGYCCQLREGCDYIEDGHSLCAMNRDPEIPLCGACLEGYSETFGSVACQRCERNSYEYILLPVTITVMFLIYLLYFDAPSNTKSVNKQHALNHAKSTDEFEEYHDEKAQKIVIRDDIKGIQLMVLKVIVYFYQGLLYILSAASNMDAATYFLLPILQVFNLSIEFGGSDSSSQGGYCFIQGMTAQVEILLNLVIPVLLIVSIFVIAMTKCNTRCCGRSPSHWTALWRATLIALGSVLAVLFKILTCRTMHNAASVHYYFGAEKCYQMTWFGALFALIVIIALWIILYVKLYKMDAQKRYLVNNNNLYTLVKAYKPEYWYWESVLLSRRIFLALFTISSIESAPNLLIITLMVILCAYFGLQLWKQPFAYTRANRLESICIFVLIVVLGYVNIDLPSDKTMSILLSMGLFICVVVVPGLCLMLEVCKLCRHLTKTKYTNRRLTKLSGRLPKHLSLGEDGTAAELEDMKTTPYRVTTKT